MCVLSSLPVLFINPFGPDPLIEDVPTLSESIVPIIVNTFVPAFFLFNFILSYEKFYNRRTY